MNKKVTAEEKLLQIEEARECYEQAYKLIQKGNGLITKYMREVKICDVEQKIARMKRELETVNYGDDCPIGGENDCANIRMAFDRGYIGGLHDALRMLGVVKTEQAESECE